MSVIPIATNILTKVPETANEVVVKSSHYILTAAAVVVAFSWNTAIQEVITVYLPKESAKEIWAKFLYAVIITIILIILIAVFPESKSELPASAQTKLNEITINYNKAKIATMSSELEACKKNSFLVPSPI